MFGIGVPELLVILVVALIFIGPQKLPEVARSVGRGYRELQRALSGVKEEIDSVETSVKEGFESKPLHQKEKAKEPVVDKEKPKI